MVSSDMAYTGRLLRSVFSRGADRHKLITSFTETTSSKATEPQKLSSLVTTGLLGMKWHYCVL